MFDDLIKYSVEKEEDLKEEQAVINDEFGSFTSCGASGVICGVVYRFDYNKYYPYDITVSGSWSKYDIDI
jgi:hypothetical protein